MITRFRASRPPYGRATSAKMVKAMRAGNGQGRSNCQDSSGSSSSQQPSPTSSAASGEQGSSDPRSHHHDVAELAERLAEQLGIKIFSSDEELEGIQNFFGDVPGFADDPAYRSEIVEEHVRAWAYANPRPPIRLTNVDGLTPLEIQAVHMGAGYYMMRPRRTQPSRDSTPSPLPVGGPSLRALQVPSPESTCKARMMSVGFPSHEEPGTSFGLLDPEEVWQVNIEEIQQELQEAALPQLERLCSPVTLRPSLLSLSGAEPTRSSLHSGAERGQGAPSQMGSFS